MGHQCDKSIEYHPFISAFYESSRKSRFINYVCIQTWLNALVIQMALAQYASK